MSEDLTTFEFTGEFINPNSAVYYNGITVPESVMKKIKKLDNKRFIIRLEDSIEYPGTPVVIAKNSYIVLVNKQRAKQLKLVPHQKVKVQLTPDNSKYGMPLPDEFKEVLSEDPEGEQLLESLTPGKIRNLIHIVAKLKNSDKRIEKSVIILEHLKANNGKLDFKMLNLAFKEYNQR